MNIINVTIDFTNGINKLTGINLITGDYASTKMVFKFDKEDGTKVFELKNPLGELVYVGEIINNELVLAAVENGHNYSIFSLEGRYIYEVSLYDGDSKLTSVKGELPVAKEQVIIDGEIVEPYLPIFDELIQDINQKIDEIDDKINNVDSKIETIDSKIEEVNTAIEETNNLNIDVSDKVNKEVTITLTKKDNTTKSVKISDGLSLQFMWQGTSLGIKTDDMQDYVFVDLQGIQGIPGPQGEPFRIKKNYPSVQAMENDFNNMQLGDYVMIASDVEQEDNAKLYTRGEIRWIFITDFSGATGIKGETGATPNIQIGSVTSGDTPSVTRTGTDENPVLNFVLKPGPTGATGPQGPTGATGNGIANIQKTSSSGLVDTYTITYTDGTTQTYEVTNGEDGEVTQSQLDEVIAENDYLNSIIDQIVPKTTATGTNITLDDTLQARMNMELNPSELEQETTTGKNKLPYTSDFSNTINGIAFTGNNGVYTMKGTTSSSAQAFTGYLALNGEYTIQSGDYLHLMNNAVGSSDTFILQFTDSNSYAPTLSTANRIVDLSSYVGKTINKIGLYVSPSTTTDVKLTPMIVNSATATEFEEYTGGIASPNPEFPMDIHTISGDNTIKVVGKNLINIEDFLKLNYSNKFETYNGVECLKLVGMSQTYNFNGRENTQYTFQFKYIGSTYTSSIGAIRLKYSDGNMDYVEIGTTPNTLYTFVSKPNKTLVGIYWGAWSGGNYIYIDKNSMQLEVGTEATSWEAFQEQLAQVNLGVENLIPKPTKINGTATNTITTNGITYTILGGGIIHISGTATAQSELYMFRPSTENETIIVPAGTYTFSSPSIPNGVKIITSGGDNNGFPYTELSSSLLSKTGNVTDGTKPFNYITIRIASGTIVDTDLCYQLEKGSVAHSFSEYGVAPIEYCKMPNTNYSDEFIKNSGKNIATTYKASGTSYYNYNLNKDKISKVMTFSFMPNITISTSTIYIAPVGGTGINVGSISPITSGTKASLTINLTDEQVNTLKSSSSVIIQIYRDNAPITENSFSQIMLNEGSTALPYEPYGTDKWYIKKNIGKAIINSNYITTYNNMVWGKFGKPSNFIGNGDYGQYLLVCECARGTTGSITGAGYIASSLNTYENAITFETGTTLEQIQALINGKTYYYELKNAEFILLNDTLQTQLDTIESMLLSYKGQTNISQINNDLPFIMTSTALKEL